MDNWHDWRTLLYPFGFLASLIFGIRAMAQWASSEKHKSSVVNTTFWHLSILGNLLLLMHAFVQVQWHICVVQACNAVIAWRNLNLMKPLDHQISYKAMLSLLFITIIGVSAAFMLQSLWYFEGLMEWMRVPTAPWNDQKAPSVTMAWHLIGFLGVILFASRFWVQWWYIEKYKISYLGKTFWWLSLFGALLSLAYFLYIHDLVSIVGPAIGIVPYIRNLMLIRKTSTLQTMHSP